MPGLAIGEHIAIGSFWIVPQLCSDICLVLLRPSSKSSPPRQVRNQIGQIQGTAGEVPGIMLGYFRKKRGRIAHTALLCENLDLAIAHWQHGDRPHRVPFQILLFLVTESHRFGRFMPKRPHEHLFGRWRVDFANSLRHRQSVLHRLQIQT